MASYLSPLSLTTWGIIQLGNDFSGWISPESRGALTSLIGAITTPILSRISLPEVPSLAPKISPEWNTWINEQLKSWGEIDRWKENKTPSLDEIQYGGANSILGALPFTGWIHAIRFSLMREALKIHDSIYSSKNDIPAKACAETISTLAKEAKITEDRSILTQIKIDVEHYVAPKKVSMESEHAFTYREVSVIATKFIASTALQWGLRYMFISTVTNLVGTITFMNMFAPEVTSLATLISLLGYAGIVLLPGIKYDLYNQIKGSGTKSLTKEQQNHIVENIIKKYIPEASKDAIETFSESLRKLKPTAQACMLKNPIVKTAVKVTAKTKTDPQKEALNKELKERQEKAKTEKEQEKKKEEQNKSEEKVSPPINPALNNNNEISLRDSSEENSKEEEVGPNEDPIVENLNKQEERVPNQKKIEELNSALKWTIEPQNAKEIRDQLLKDLTTIKNPEHWYLTHIKQCTAGIERAISKSSSKEFKKYSIDQASSIVAYLKLIKADHLINSHIEERIKSLNEESARVEKWKGQKFISETIDELNKLKTDQK